MSLLPIVFFLALLPHASGQIIATGLLESKISLETARQQAAPVSVTTKSEPLLVEPYIFAGTKAEPNEFPWIVKSASPASICTGALIHEDIALTAAHCQGVFFDGMIISAYNFSNSIEDSIYREVEMQVRHKGYNQNVSVIVDDLMVIKLSQPVTEILPVALNRDPDFPVAYEKLYAAGFGLISYEQDTPSELQKVDLHYIPRKSVEITTDGSIMSVRVQGCYASRERDKSVCHGDSGGPLVTEDKSTLVGVTSFGALCETTLAPNGFSRIAYYYDWIQEQICELSANPPSSCAQSARVANPEAVAINITVQHDFFSWETTWSVRDKADNSIQVVGPINNPSSYSLWFTTVDLLPGEYTFELYDMNGDGMAAFANDAPITLGWFELSIASTEADRGILIPQTNATFTKVMVNDFVQIGGKLVSSGQLTIPSVVPSLYPLSQLSSSIRSGQDWAAVQVTTDNDATSGCIQYPISGASLLLAFFLALQSSVTGYL